MNIFEVFPKVLFIEDEWDLSFVQFLKETKNLQFLNMDGESVNEFKIGDVLTIKSNIKEYVVKPSDTLDSIAKKLNISRLELLNKAGGENLFVGQKIKL